MDHHNDFTSDAPGEGRNASCNRLAATQCAPSNHLGGYDPNQAVKPSGWQSSVDLQVAEGMVQVTITLKPIVLDQKERRNEHGDNCSASMCNGGSKSLMQHSSPDWDTRPSGRYCSVGLQAAEHLGMCQDSANVDSTEQPNISNSNVKAEGGPPITQGQCQSGCMKDEHSSPSWEIGPSGRSCPVDLQVAEHSNGKEERSSPSWEIGPSGRSCPVDLQVAEHSSMKEEQSSPSWEIRPSGRSCPVDLQVAEHSKPPSSLATHGTPSYCALPPRARRKLLESCLACLRIRGGAPKERARGKHAQAVGANVGANAQGPRRYREVRDAPATTRRARRGD